MTTANLIEIFCILDEFCKYFTPELKKHMVDTSGKRRRNRPCRLSDSEVMTILVLFHTMHFRDLKSFYLGYVCLSPYGLLQPFCGAAGTSVPSPVAVPSDLRPGQVYWHFHHRLHTVGVVSH